MNNFPRRTFLAALPAALAWPYLGAATPPNPVPAGIKPLKNAIVYRFTIGDIEAFSISDGTLRFGSPAVMMYPEAQRAAMQAALLSQRGELTRVLGNLKSEEEVSQEV